MIVIWSLVEGFANLILAGQFARRLDLKPEALADQLILAMIRPYFLGPRTGSAAPAN
ncbi:MAG: hypothetical protein GY798_30690 [Hyphomicrobiales bacterium]|nr:hypothetical protein [Hyphomicrobiales bacterium]